MHLNIQRISLGLGLPGDYDANLTDLNGRSVTLISEHATKKAAAAHAATIPDAAKPSVCGYLSGRRERGWVVTAMTSETERKVAGYFGATIPTHNQEAWRKALTEPAPPAALKPFSLPKAA